MQDQTNKLTTLDPSKELFIIGNGGFAREVLCLVHDLFPTLSLSKWVRFAVPDDKLNENHTMNIPLVPESKIGNGSQAVIAIGNPARREKVAKKIKTAFNVTFPTLVHPSATLSPWVTLSEGGIVSAGTIFTCNISVGPHSYFNLNSTISHDCKIGSYFTASSGVNISGNCTIGDRVYFGANSACRQGLCISSDIVIGMGGVVVKNLNSAGTYIGTPAKRMS